jgi:hypothetical protein
VQEELFMTFMFRATQNKRIRRQFGKYVACEPVHILLGVGLRNGFGGPLKGYSIQVALRTFVNVEG